MSIPNNLLIISTFLVLFGFSFGQTFHKKVNSGIYSKPLAYNFPPLDVVENQHVEPGSLWGDFVAPLPTNSFYMNFGFGDNGIYDFDGSFPINQLPYFVRPMKDGVQLCYPVKTNNSVLVITHYHKDFSLKGIGAQFDRKIESMDLMSVTSSWNKWDGTLGLRTYVVRGSPYITSYFNGTQPSFDTWSIIISINGAYHANAKVRGNKFKVVTSNGQTWIIYSENGDITLTISPDRQHIFAIEESFVGYIRVALMYRDEDEEDLDTYRHSIAVGGDVKVDIGESSTTANKYQITWKGIDNMGKPTSDPLLVLGLPHHEDILSNVKKTMPRTYNTIKGKMSGYIGNNWVLTETFNNITWTSKNSIDEDKADSIKAALEVDMLDGTRGFYPPDCYGFGKYISSLGRIALIAEELGMPEISNNVTNRMAAEMDHWFRSSTPNYTFVYDSVWGGIISYEGWIDKGTDYGNGKYNDHHFHYGYFIYAASIILKYDPENPIKEDVLPLIRDIANPSSADPYFPVTRHKDWYTGHSWAAGLDPVPDAKNQESTSEAVNAYYAIKLFGITTGDKMIENLGDILMATEIRSTQLYYHIFSEDIAKYDIYPEGFREKTIVGVLWSTKAEYTTFFGPLTEYIHCIHMLPFTPITEYLLRKNWTKEEYPVLETSLTADPPIEKEWKAYVYEDLAILDKETAWSNIQKLDFSEFALKGNTLTNALWWIATRD